MGFHVQQSVLDERAVGQLTSLYLGQKIPFVVQIIALFFSEEDT